MPYHVHHAHIPSVNRSIGQLSAVRNSYIEILGIFSEVEKRGAADQKSAALGCSSKALARKFRCRFWGHLVP